jgi:transcriptional regulator with XRE-family HTH domain
MRAGRCTVTRINFGYTLRKLRRSRDETLEQVSEATGLSVAMLSRIERGERLPSPDSVEALARHFELPVDYLMSETIANRMVNQYGEKSSRSAAEHMSRESVDLESPAGPIDEDDETDRSVARGYARGSARPSRPSYGVFQEMDVLAALASSAPQTGAPQTAAPSSPPPIELSGADHLEALGLVADVSPASAFRAVPLGPASGRGPGSKIDPATAQVLRAAMEASEAAAVLVRRQAPSLSVEARLELIDKVGVLAGQAFDVLRMLASDPDARVRAAAGEALGRLTGSL